MVFGAFEVENFVVSCTLRVVALRSSGHARFDAIFAVLASFIAKVHSRQFAKGTKSGKNVLLVKGKMFPKPCGLLGFSF